MMQFLRWVIFNLLCVLEISKSHKLNYFMYWFVLEVTCLRVIKDQINC